MLVEVLCWIYRVWSSKECACCACDSSVDLNVPYIGVCSPYIVSLCDFTYYVVG